MQEPAATLSALCQLQRWDKSLQSSWWCKDIIVRLKTYISSMLDYLCSNYDWLILFKLCLVDFVQFNEHLVMATFLMPNMIVRLKGGDDFNCSVRWGPYLGATKDLFTQSQHETSAFKVLTCSSRQTKRPPCWHLLWATLLSISTSQLSVKNEYFKYGQASPQTFWF